MSIVATCSCGSKFKAKDELAGKRVKCPSCGQPLTVPNKEAVGTPIRVTCQCGQAFQAKAELAGKRVTCPSCHHPLTIPSAQAPVSQNPDPLGLGDSPPDPLGLGAASDDPPGLGTPGIDTLGGAQNPPAGYISNPISTPVSADRSKAKRQKIKIDTDVVTTVTAILCIIHGLGRIGSLYGIFFLITSGSVFSWVGILGLATAAVSVGIGVAGVGLLTKQDWAMQVGSIAAIGYFGIMIMSLIVMVVTVAQAPSGFGLGVFALLIPRLIAESIGPGALLYVTMRDL